MWPRALLVLVGAVLLFVAITAWALESGDVAVLATTRPDGTTRETHVWFVVRDGELWVEAGTPENGWFRDVQESPLLEFRSDTLSGRFRARPDDDPAAHPRLRAALREKYGVRDRWVSLLVDGSRSLAVRLQPTAP